ncbi:MAG: ABC transporter substrate-binding protein [Candidatus Aenigmatarchaeota archaeon]
MVSKKLALIVILIGFISAILGSMLTYFSLKKETEIQEPEANILIIYHWWVSPGEEAAIDALINLFAEKYPGTAIMPTTVRGKSPGGGGVELFNVIKNMAKVGEAPDVFQMNGGYSGKTFYDEGYLKQIDYLWESEGLENIIPSIVQDLCKFDGHYYSVPVGIHRNNVVWYNKHLLEENGIDPNSLTTWDAFFNACDKLKAAGIEYPIQMGPAWTAELVFEGIAAGTDLKFYEDLINGRVTSPSDERLLRTLEIFKKYLSYVNPDNEKITWDEAIKRIMNREGAFNIMGDWANGEFKAKGMVYGVDYGTIPVPGTNDMYSVCADVFLQPKNAHHPLNADRWFRMVVSRDGQDTFNPLKGSISARTDANITKYDAYQKSAITDFWKVRYMYPTLSNGVPKAFEIKIQEILAEFIKDLNVSKAASAIASYTQEISNMFTIRWSIV